MTIQKLELSDDGLYICSATNKAGVTANSTSSTHLTVISNDKPGKLSKQFQFFFSVKHTLVNYRRKHSLTMLFQNMLRNM